MTLLRRFILLGLILLLAATSVWAGKLICDHCKKPIESGNYYEADGRYYHANHFLCERCSRPIGKQKYWTENGKIYDSTCYVTLFNPRCAYCDKIIADRWVIFGGREYHKSCYEDHVAERCAICNKPLEGTYLYDDFGNKVHAEHLNEVKQCDYCSRLIAPASNGGEQYRDGRIVCGICLETAITDKREADSLVRIVRGYLAAEGIIVSAKKIPLELVDKNEMAKITQSPKKALQGFTKFTQRETMLGLIKDNSIKVYVLEGMPRMAFIGTAAHELMHVWFGLNSRFNTDEVLSEGSCNYAAYLVLKNYQDDAELAIKQLNTDKDPVYGEGFRKVKTYAESVGTQAWLDYLKTADAPPW